MPRSDDGGVQMPDGTVRYFPDEELTELPSVSRRRSLVSLFLVLIGMIALVTGTTALFGWEVSTTVAGVLLIGIGLLLGTDRT